MPQHRKGDVELRQLPEPVAGVRAMARALRPARAFQFGRVLGRPARPRPRPLRAMFMTPWLAAGVGVVLAAALALHGPRTQLTYIPAHPCAPDHCGVSVPGPGAGGTTLSGPAGPVTRLKHGRKALPATGPAPSGHGPAPARRLLVRYQTVQRRPGGFTGLITMTGRAVRAGWQLTFRYPGATVVSVAGAPWTVDGAEVTVTGGLSPAPGQAAGRVRLRIRASGTPSRPTGCSFNGVACSIH
jgi:hypothetical protein